MKIIVTPPFTEEQKKKIRDAAGPEELVFALKSEITPELLSDADVILGNLDSPSQVRWAPGLKWIQLNNAGTEGYCEPGLLPEGAVLTNATGAYGLARFPGIRNLRIIDTAANGNDTGVFTEANISTNEDGKKVWDFSSLTLYKYQHANMGKTGRDVEVFYTPQQLDILNIDSASVIDSAKRDPHLNGVSVSAVSNYLGADSPCEFLWGANTKQTLTQLIIGNNSFDSFEVSGFSGLQAVFADGSDGVGSDGSDHGRYLSIHDCSALEYV